MIVINVIGGLGNQMFQYAIGRSIAYNNKGILKLDITSFSNYELRKFELECFNINASIATEPEVRSFEKPCVDLVNKYSKKLIRKDIFSNKQLVREKGFCFDPNVLKLKRGHFFGYWQTEKYFKDIEQIIVEDFSFKLPLSSASLNIKSLVLSVDSSVSLHVRRGDYISNKTTNDYHGTCSLDYYQCAINIILKTNPSARFFVFSDDLEWAKENITFIDNVVFVDLKEESADWEEMYLMSQCSHNIIANSSFSWWGAWLNRNPEKIVIAPKKWFSDSSIDTSDLIPDDWIRI